LQQCSGRKLAAHFIPKIGAAKAWMLIKRVITLPDTNKGQCENYGEVLLLAWKNTLKEGDENNKLQEQLERVFMDVVYYALQHLHCNKNFMAMLEPLNKARNKQIDEMIFRTFEPNLWRCLKAANDSVRYNACCLFLPFYPFVCEDDIHVIVQQGLILDLLRDENYAIRADACRRTLFILSTHFDTFPVDFIKRSFTQVYVGLVHLGTLTQLIFLWFTLSSNWCAV
uniref:MMS19 nucleotide excision repair protein n=1 Tax=Gongylonema pulchrum TaxID=637853 RepID=A0A183DXD5_9BILA